MSILLSDYWKLIPIEPMPEVGGFYVYVGRDCGKVRYIGTTTQVPRRRFDYHKANGKDLYFTVIASLDNAIDMIDLEFMLIRHYHPKLNKITKRKQNSNVPLSVEDLELRKGNNEWCQSCLTRRVNKGYKFCYFCQTGR